MNRCCRLFHFSLCWLLILCLLAGCGRPSSGAHYESQPDPELSYRDSVNLLFCNTDSLNPYTLTTEVNFELCQLLYEPLYRVDSDFSAVNALSLSSERDGKVWTITLKDALFSDGSPVTAEDVLYSYRLAAELPRYSTGFSKVSSISGQGKTVVFTLAGVDPYFSSLLTFPVLKQDSDNRRDEDGVALPPIGCGRFSLNENHDGLEQNPHYYGQPGTITRVSLIDTPDSESVSHYVEVGATDFYYAADTNRSVHRMSGKKAAVLQNELVYLAVNAARPILSDARMRYAVSSCLDRDKITQGAYFGNAVSATGPFHPNFRQVANFQTIETSANLQIAIENLREMGYNSTDGSPYLSKNGSTLHLELLINSENASRKAAASLMVSQFKEAGIELTVRSLPFADYQAALQAGEFDLCLCETRIDNNFDLSPLVLPGGSAAYGVVPAAEGEADLSAILQQYADGELDIRNVVSAVESVLPFIPVCYRSGVLFYSEKANDITGLTESNLFSQIGDWKITT